MRLSSAVPILLALAASSSSFGCLQVLGLDEYKEGGSGGSGVTGSGATSSSGGPGATSGTGTGTGSGGGGGGAPMPGDVLWARSFGDPSKQVVTGVGVDPQGNIYVTGLMFGSMQIDTQLLTSAGEDLFLFSLDKTGALRWAKSFPIAASSNVPVASLGVAVDGSAVVIAGVRPQGQGSPMNFGNGNKDGLFIAKLTLGGAPLWSIGCGGGPTYNLALSPTAIGSVSLDATGDIVVSAAVAGVKCAGAILGGNVLYGFDPSGVVTGSYQLGFGGYTEGGLSKAIGNGSSVFASTQYSGQTTGVRLISNSSVVWTNLWQPPGVVEMFDIAIDAGGRSTTVGAFTAPVDFGGGPLAPVGPRDALLVQYSSTGAHLTSQRFGNGATASAVAVAPDGQFVLAGTFADSIDFGQGPRKVADGATFLTHFDTNATATAVFQYRSVVPVRAVYLPNNRLLLVGNLEGTGDFGGHSLVDQGGGDVAVALIQL